MSENDPTRSAGLTRPRGGWRKCIGIVVASVLAAVAIWWLWFPGRSFDAVAWKADEFTSSGVRQAMADRLLARRTLPGMTREQVIDLLDEPTKSGHKSDWDLAYCLGRERGYFAIDSEWLVLRFDESGRVIEARLVTD